MIINLIFSQKFTLLIIFLFVILINPINAITYTIEENYSSEDIRRSKITIDNEIITDEQIIRINNENINISAYITLNYSEKIFDSQVDDIGNIFIVGTTNSTNFLTKNAYCTSLHGMDDIFLSKYDSKGNLIFSTYFGGQNYDNLIKTEIDTSGNIYLLGVTNSTDLQIKNSIKSVLSGETDIFLTKFSSSGQLVFSTYLGGAGIEKDPKIIVKDKIVILSGKTNSMNFPLLNANTNTYQGDPFDLFLSEFDTKGNLIFSTYIGGNNEEQITKFQLDGAGNILISGWTNSTNFSLYNAFDKNYGGGLNDCFLIKLSSSGKLLFSTYFGGDNYESISNLLTDKENNIYLGGFTSSSDFTTNNYTYRGGGDVFIAKFHANGNLDYFTYFGGKNLDSIELMSIDQKGQIYISGVTNSNDFPILNAFDSVLTSNILGSPSSDVFLSKFSPEFQLLFSTYLGGSGYERVEDMNVDIFENICISGSTSSSNFPLKNAYDETYNGGNTNWLFITSDWFLAKFSKNGSIVFSTYFGGNNTENFSMHVFSGGNILLIGFTNSIDFSTLNAYDSSFNGKFDIFLGEFNSTGSLLYSTFLGGEGIEILGKISYKNNCYYLTSINYDDESTKQITNPNYSSDEAGRFLIVLTFFHDKDFDAMDDDWESINGLSININDSMLDKDGDGMSNIYEYRMGLLVNVDDAMLDKDGDGMSNLYEYQMGLLANVDDAMLDKDGDGMSNLYEYQMGLLANVDDTMLDKDGDGMPNGYEFQMGLLPNVDDSMLDKDGDGMPNRYEYQMGLLPNLDDSKLDKDGDGMPNLYEYQNNFNPIDKSDAKKDSDGDMVSNIDEYQHGTDPRDIMSFPIEKMNIFYYLVTILGLSSIFGLIVIRIFVTVRIRIELSKTGSPNKIILKKLKNGGFLNYQEYKEALWYGVDNKSDLNLILTYQAPDLQTAKLISELGIENFNEFVKMNNKRDE